MRFTLTNIFLSAALCFGCTDDPKLEQTGDAQTSPGDADTPSTPGDAQTASADSSLPGASDAGTGTGPGNADASGQNVGSDGGALTADDAGGSDAMAAADSSGMAGPVTKCAKTLFGRYLLRDDGALLYEADPPSVAQTPVLDAASGLPLAGVTQATEGNAHGCAVLGATKTVWCWRTVAAGNSVGQLGNGAIDTTGPLFRATQVLTAPNQPLINIVGISQGTSEVWGTNACAVSADGRLYCWGHVQWITNGGTALDSPYAIPVTTDGATPLTGVLSVTLGSSYYTTLNTRPTVACAIVQGASSNEVRCWGANGGGNLGTGDTTARPYPTTVVGLSAPTKVVAFGRATTCALDGANVRCWGNNMQGQVGNGTTSTPILAPTLVTLMGGGSSALGSIVDLRGGSDQARDDVCALASDNTLKCWGVNFATSPTNYGGANIVALGSVDASAVRFLTSDGLYHYSLTARNIAPTVRVPNCGLLQ